MYQLSKASACLLLIFTLLAYCGLTYAAARAQQITATTAEQLNSDGPDAIGGIGDWHLSNGTLCAIISDIGHEHEFSAKGGSLVDLGFCDRADDHYSFSQDLLDGERTRPLNGETIRTESNSSRASIIVTSRSAGVEMTTRYSLDQQEPTQLNIRKTLRRTDPEINQFNLISLGSFNYHSLEPFVLAAQAPLQSPGFTNTDFVSRGVSAIGESAHDADTIILTSPPDAQHPIAYGWRLLSATRVEGGRSKPLPRFALADEEATAMMVLADDFWIGDGRKIGWLQLIQIPFLSLPKDATIETEEIIYVGRGAGVAAASDQIFSAAALISGRAEPETAVHLLHQNGGAVTHQRVDSSGHFSFRAPAGEYILRHRGNADRSVEYKVQHGNTNSDLGQLSLPQVARLQLPRETAMRLVFVGLNGTPSPDFSDRLTDFLVTDGEGESRADRLAQVFLAGVASDPSSINLPAGQYRIYATRGPEYSVESSDLVLTAGETRTLEISRPRREIETPGFLAADFHVHAGDSFDNTFSNEERVRTFVAEHGEVMVNSEHDVVVDFAPLVEAMGVGDKITALTGAEMTSLLPTKEMPFTGGHVNFFPYQSQPLAYRNGMVRHENRRLREIIHDVRAANPGVIAQLNHPRRNLFLSDGAPDNFEELIDNGAYLDHMGVAAHPYHPAQPLHSHPNNKLIEPHPETGIRDLDVDAIEIVNPGGEYHADRVAAVRRDWLSFLLQGERMTGTANSDSHRGSQQVAVPRNMVAVTNDDVNDFSRAEFLASIKGGNLYGTTGPMMTLDLSGTPMGGTHTGDQGVLSLNVLVASWVPVQSAVIQINGKTVHTFNLLQQRAHQVSLEFSKDSFVTVELLGEPGEIYRKLYPGIQPYAFSNPIYVDADSDGQWQAPGLNTGE